MSSSDRRPSDPQVDALLGRYLPRLRAFVRLQADPALRAVESASDLVQSACREVLAEGSVFEYRGEAEFRSYLFRAALNKVRERARFHRAARRDRQRRVALAGTDGDLAALYAQITSPTQAAAAHELGERIERAFDQLSEEHRDVILLSRVVGLSTAEVAQHMGRSEGAVRMLLSRALVQLLAIVERRGGGGGGTD